MLTWTFNLVFNTILPLTNRLWTFLSTNINIPILGDVSVLAVLSGAGIITILTLIIVKEVVA